LLRIAFTIALPLLLLGCQAPADPIFGPSQITGQSEALAGARAAPAVEARFGGVLADPIAEQRMTQITQRLAQNHPELKGPYYCQILASDQINAISLPGGRIYISQGLYSKLTSDELVAAVLAHEMAHIASNDSLKPRCRDLDESLVRELSADARGAVYLKHSGFHPSAMADLIYLIQDVQPSGWVTKRIANISKQ